MVPYKVAFLLKYIKLDIALSALTYATSQRALVFTLSGRIILHNVSQNSSHGIAAAASSGECSAVSCGQVKSKDVFYSDD